MKYITVSQSNTANRKPLTPDQFFETATYLELEEVAACLSGKVGGSFVMVRRSHTELEVIVLEPEFAKPLEGQADAADWYCAIQAIKAGPVKQTSVTEED